MVTVIYTQIMFKAINIQFGLRYKNNIYIRIFPFFCSSKAEKIYHKIKLYMFHGFFLVRCEIFAVKFGSIDICIYEKIEIVYKS